MNSILRRRRALMGAQKENLHLNDILTLDGIMNTRSGHDASATTWQNLCSTSYNFVKASGSEDLNWQSNCLRFNGTNQRLYNGSNFITGNSTISIEIVVKPTGTPNGVTGNDYYGIIYKNGSGDTNAGLSFLQYNNYGLSSLCNGTNLGYTSLGANTTKYVCFVITPTKSYKYVNGSYVSSVDLSFDDTQTSQYNYIGYNYTKTDWYPYCDLFRLGISGRALAAEEIAERYTYFKKRFNF